MGADVFMRSLIVWRLGALKISASCKFVIKSVFEGGVGWVRGGIFERSMDMLLFRDARDVGRDVGGDVGEVGESAVGDNSGDDDMLIVGFALLRRTLERFSESIDSVKSVVVV